MSIITLSPEQRAVAADVKAKRNILVTGPAGSGKSTLLNYFRSTYGAKLSVAASTGIAALNVGGTTLHSFAGLGLGKREASEIASDIMGDKKSRAFRNITQCHILAVDEISMVSGQLLDKTDEVFRRVRRNHAPFGGIQVIFFGDFLQAPPISKEDEPASFAFESRVWKQAEVATRMLTKVFRQADQAFADALGRLRVGDINHPSIALIASRNNLPIPNDGIRPVKLHTHNADVERLNMAELAKVDGKELSFEARETGDHSYKEKLDRDCLAPRVLRLKKGAQVMLLTNLNLDEGLVNGSLGTVIDLKEDEILVRFGINKVIKMERHTWAIQNNGVNLASREQYPLRLAYALTIHKCQGMTLDRIECWLGDNVFEYGLAYVAVSRCKTLSGLFLRRSSRKAFRAHPKALAFYEEAARQVGQMEFAA